jgi:hypothetical protein
MNISPNFTLQEFTRSETAMIKGYSEQYSPSKNVVENLKLLAVNIAEKIRTEFGAFTPTVAYRCERTNKAVGGVATSEHLIGCSFDETFIKDGKNISKAVFLWCINGGLPNFSQIIWEFGNKDNPNWLHIGYNSNNNKKEILVSERNAFGGVNYIKYRGSSLERYHKIPNFAKDK